ncbi:MAG: PDZ domain-containing protein [Clostridia bacterium]|nr:PDZ domain-containing protein [Clostridia bacterium]
MSENENKIEASAPEAAVEETGRRRRAAGGRPEKSGVPVPTVIVIVLMFVLATFMTTYLLVTQSIMNEMSGGKKGVPEEAYEKISQIDKMLEAEFLYEVDEDALASSMIKGYMYGLGDLYAEYFTKEEFEALMSDTNAEMQGIGVSVAMDSEQGMIQIIKVFPDSPAMEAGVQTGDIITHIKTEGEMVSVSSVGYTMALNALRGEAGTLAEFVVARGEGYGETVEFSIERGFVTEYTVSYKVSEGDESIGIISISSFDKKTPEQFKEAYESLLAEGCEKLIIDVRNNPGGELISVCTTLDMLVPEGPVIRTVDKNGNEEVVYTSDKNETNVPIAVLVNGGTASAGELFAAALSDYEKAVLVGENTFGKGSMQTTRSFSDGTAFKYTYRYYCPPFSDNFDGEGIAPDIEAGFPEGFNIYTIPESEDTQLQAAIAELNK